MKLTARETEIAKVLEAEPLISQDELARRLDLSRSSVAVHISNLMKKGVILGKGYVFNQKVSLAVLGDTFLQVLVAHDSEQTQIDVTTNGFAPELSRVIAQFGVDTRILSLLGNDDLANRIRSEMVSLGIDVNGLDTHPNKRTCRKIMVNDKLCFQEGFSTEDYISFMDRNELTMIQCNYLLVQHDYQRYFLQKDLEIYSRMPFLCGSIHLTEDLPVFLEKFYLLVLGVHDLKQREQHFAFGETLVRNGLQHCFLTDGCNEVIYINEQGIHDFTLTPNQSFNQASHLHLFLAGVVYGISKGYPWRQAIRIAIGTASGKGEKEMNFSHSWE